MNEASFVLVLSVALIAPLLSLGTVESSACDRGDSHWSRHREQLPAPT